MPRSPKRPTLPFYRNQRVRVPSTFSHIKSSVLGFNLRQRLKCSSCPSCLHNDLFSRRLGPEQRQSAALDLQLSAERACLCHRHAPATVAHPPDEVLNCGFSFSSYRWHRG